MPVGDVELNRKHQLLKEYRISRAPEGAMPFGRVHYALYPTLTSEKNRSKQCLGHPATLPFQGTRNIRMCWATHNSCAEGGCVLTLTASKGLPYSPVSLTCSPTEKQPQSLNQTLQMAENKKILFLLIYYWKKSALGKILKFSLGMSA